MKLKQFVAAVVLPVACLCGVSASAQSLKCKNDFSQLGDSRAVILQKCGEPFAKDSFCKPADTVTGASPGKGVIVNVQPCETVDEWTYNPGYGQFITTLRFESGVLKSVKYGDRVR